MGPQTVVAGENDEGLLIESARFELPEQLADGVITKGQRIRDLCVTERDFIEGGLSV
jgi:hypothetical protein